MGFSLNSVEISGTIKPNVNKNIPTGRYPKRKGTNFKNPRVRSIPKDMELSTPYKL